MGTTRICCKSLEAAVHQNLKVHIKVGSPFIEIDKQEDEDTSSDMTYEDALATLQEFTDKFRNLIQPVDTLDAPSSPI